MVAGLVGIGCSLEPSGRSDLLTYSRPTRIEKALQVQLPYLSKALTVQHTTARKTARRADLGVTRSSGDIDQHVNRSNLGRGIPAFPDSVIDSNAKLLINLYLRFPFRLIELTIRNIEIG